VSTSTHIADFTLSIWYNYIKAEIINLIVYIFNMQNYQKGNTNTVLIVVVLLLLVGFGVWWFTMRNEAVDNDGGVNIQLGGDSQ